MASMATISGRRYASIHFADTITEMTEPIPKISRAMPMPPARPIISTSNVM